MASLIKRAVLSPIPRLFPERIGDTIAGFFSRKLKQELLGEVTDKFLELLLGGMDFAFTISKGYRENIRDFKGRYLFQTADNLVSSAAVFENGNMKVYSTAIDDWDARITFKDAAAMRRYIFSKDQDILNSILANEVEVDGNLNYIYKFGFMARDLSKRLGIE